MNKKTEKKSQSVEETEQIAAEFFKTLKSHSPSSRARVVGLYGNLGSGKTIFTKAIGKILGVEETIQSPTFVLQKSYETKDSTFKKLFHLDFYRIEDVSELNILHLEEMFNSPQNIVLIEWPEKAEKNNHSQPTLVVNMVDEEKVDEKNKPHILPNDLIKVNFRFIDDVTRKISYEL